jgi:DNA repair protein SbcD/Mre11
MKIAITADIHLKNKEKYSERYNALKNILDQLIECNINNLIIAGDLFDINSQNYSIFDELCKQKRYRQIKFHVIPGNHDSNINSKYFTADNINIINEPVITSINNSNVNFFFIPYLLGKSMGEIIANYKNNLPELWILIGHGDYLSGLKSINSYEPGVYMPLSRADIDYYNPAIVVLGHIHKKDSFGKVHYTGSPCGMDINETGRKSFIVLDLNNLNIQSKEVITDYIFFNETLVSLPVSNEFDYIKNKLSALIKNWGIEKEEIPKARIRLKVKGYTSDLKKLNSVITKELKSFKFVNDEGPDLNSVSVFSDPDRISIVERIKKELDNLEKDSEYKKYDKDAILEQALNLILIN